MSDDRIILITGASRGIGAALARALGVQGNHLLLVARTVGGLEEVHDDIVAAGGKASIIPLDLQEFDKIDMLGAQLAERFGRIDVVIANAAILGDLTPLSHYVPKIWQRVMDVNVTANYRLVRSLQPLLQKSADAIIAFVTADEAKTAPAFYSGYAASKAALEAMAASYAHELGDKIRISVVNPGIVETDLRKQAMPGEALGTHPLPEAITPNLLKEIGLS